VVRALTKACILGAHQCDPAILRPPTYAELAMTKSKPKTEPKKKATTLKEGSPTEEAKPVSVPKSAFSVGDWVHHPMFGEGKIESITDDKLTIKFEGTSRRKFATTLSRASDDRGGDPEHNAVHWRPFPRFFPTQAIRAPPRRRPEPATMNYPTLTVHPLLHSPRRPAWCA
jgi:hypothetical protein